MDQLPLFRNYTVQHLREQTYSILGPDYKLKEKKKAWELDLQQNPSCTHIPYSLSLAHTPGLLPSYLLATMNQI